jgi:hypothetical protein
MRQVTVPHSMRFGYAPGKMTAGHDKPWPRGGDEMTIATNRQTRSCLDSPYLEIQSKQNS